MHRTLALLALLAAAANAGKFDQWDTCQKCIDAGWGWSLKKGKCGAFPNKVCPEDAGGGAAAAAPAYDGTVVELDDKSFDAYVQREDIVIVEFFAPWCGHCKKLEPIYSATAKQLVSELPNVRFAKVDSTADGSADTKAKFGVTGFPMVFVFRAGEKQYKILEQPQERTVERISAIVKHEAAQPPPPPPGAAIFMKFDLEGSSKLMEHKIKSQIAFFYSERDKQSKSWLKELEATAEGFAGQIIMLYVDIDDQQNKPVLGRFGVGAHQIPCLRVAQIYPEERGGGMEIFQPDTAANPAYQDKKPRTKAAFDAFVTDHLAEGDPLKGGRITVPFLRSEPRPMKSHPHVVDLVGNTYDSYIAQKGRACLSFFYMPTCPHCGELEPVWEEVATKLAALNKKRPSGSAEVTMLRMNTVRNDVAHFQIFTGSYPTIYWIPADDKENVTLLSTGGEFSSDEWIWAHLAQEVDWLANVDPATGTLKDEKEL